MPDKALTMSEKCKMFRAFSDLQKLPNQDKSYK